MSATSSSSTCVKKTLSWMATTLICTNVVLSCLVGGAWYRFGSIPAPWPTPPANACWLIPKRNRLALSMRERNLPSSSV